MSNKETVLPVGGHSIKTPCFFPSISSVKTNLRVKDYLEFLISTREPQFLISAYDIFNADEDDRSAIFKGLKRADANGQKVLLDSGIYEKYWLRDNSWGKTEFEKVLGLFNFHIAFCFDDIENPRIGPSIDKAKESLLVNETTTILPIVHGGSGSLLDNVISTIKDSNPIMIGIPERELGQGILARAKSVFEISKAINEIESNSLIHLLGTGNPISILLYAYCGADSFDGLEWCQTVVDPTTANLFHFQQRELFDNAPSNLTYDLATLTFPHFIGQSALDSFSLFNKFLWC